MGLFLLKNKKVLFAFLITFVICFMIYPKFLFADSDDASFPNYTGFVNDFAGILDSKSISDLEALTSNVESETGSEIAVVTIIPLDMQGDQASSDDTLGSESDSKTAIVALPTNIYLGLVDLFNSNKPKVLNVNFNDLGYTIR